MHFERRGMDEQARPDELVVLMVLAQNVAHILAEKTLDALAELLYPFDISLLHAPGSVGRVGSARLEFSDCQFGAEVPRDVCDQVTDDGEGVHGFEDDWH